jgi:hypothetical protein
MRCFVRCILLLCLMPSVVSFADMLIIQPTTSLRAQTSNNTSAADTFVSQANGNLGSANISKGNIHSLLHVNSAVPVYAHLMLWFGGTNHMNVGYSSTDPTQVRRQITDMISRGIDGVIIDWYGVGDETDRGTRLVMQEAEKHPGFTFAIMVDKGAIQWHSCSGCDPQQALISDLQYIERAYAASPAYLKRDGAPVIANFDMDSFYQVDWTAVQNALTAPPAFLFQDANGFTHTLSQGSYAWVMPTASNYGLDYLANFYATGIAYPYDRAIGAAYKGFNDSLASWGSGRVMDQQCGQTWLQTFSELNGSYDSANPQAALQLVTWNDYEEGTEIETGIDNCVSVSATTADGVLQWSLAGQENTISNYTVYISQDGHGLMPLTSIPPGQNALNLCNYSLAKQQYVLYVQAVGLPTLANHMSSPAPYTPQCGD